MSKQVDKDQNKQEDQKEKGGDEDVQLGEARNSMTNYDEQSQSPEINFVSQSAPF